MPKLWEELNTVNYYNYLNSIIEERGQWAKIDNCARHHIILRCKGGLPERLDNSKHDNIIWLTHFEHAMAHCILARDNLDDFEVCFPVSFMLKDCTPDDILNYNITPEEYNLIYSASQSRPGESNGMYGKTHTQESINKILSHRRLESYQTKEFREKRSAHSRLSKWFTDGVNESFTTECPDG